MTLKEQINKGFLIGKSNKSNVGKTFDNNVVAKIIEEEIA